ncbi:MAG: hypothetical protein JWM53_348 [bacterium]|nr:hypothetical protein [bacterium]
MLFSPATARDVEKARTEQNTKPGKGNALIDGVTQQPKVGGDANESIVDQITGKTPQKK